MKSKLLRAAVLPCLCLFMAAGAAAQDSPVISEGVYVGDKDVSGMTSDELKSYIEEEVSALESSKITIVMGDDSVSSTWAELGLTWTNTDIVQEISELGTTGNIIRRYKEQKDLENQSTNYEIEYELDESAEEAFVRSLSVYNSDPVEGSVYMDNNGELMVEGGTNGITVDVDATLVSLKEYLLTYEAGDAVIQATTDVTTPVLTRELLSQMTDILGTATTDYSSSSANRATNVRIGTDKINGTLLMPGETFSVTNAVVPFTAENGYELAPSYEAGQVVDSYGGGICQVSTTLYNAVLKAELEVDKRSNHTMTVSYVEPSMDAAIAEGIMDFVFTNNLDYPIYIAGTASGGRLTFTIYGVETRPSNRTIKFVSETISEIEPTDKITLVAKTDENVGYLYQAQTAHQGLNAVLWKEIYYDGVLSETVQINSSTYTPASTIYEVGVVTDNAELSAAMYSAIAANDLSQVQNLIIYGVSGKTNSDKNVNETENSNNDDKNNESEKTQQTESTEAPKQTETEPAATDQPETEPAAPEQTDTEPAETEQTEESGAETLAETVIVE